jgi:hypothetical protein
MGLLAESMAVSFVEILASVWFLLVLGGFLALYVWVVRP